MWKAYDRIDQIHDKDFYYYTHESVNHSVNFKDPSTGAHTNTCEGSWRSQYKNFIPTQAYNKNALQGHLFERVWKRKYRAALWANIVRAMVEV